MLAGCLGGDGDGDGDGDGGVTDTASPEPSGPVVIGALEPLSGNFAPWGAVHQQGLEFAVNEVNEMGGVLGGRDLELTVTDTASDSAEADSAFRRMVEQDGAVATTGGVSSDVGIRLNQTANDLEVAHLLQMSGSSEVITEESRYMFRIGLVPSVTYIQAQASAFAGDYSNIGAIIADYAWGRAVESAIPQAFDQDVQIEVAPVGESDFRSYIRQFDEDLEMIVASGHPPGAIPIANQIQELGYSPEVITGASVPPNILAGALTEAGRAVYTHPHNSDPYTEAFADVASGFAESYDTQFNTHTAYGYVAGKLLAQAIDDAGSDDPVAIADSIRGIEFDTLLSRPIKYSQYGELDGMQVIFSQIRTEAPAYDSDGSFDYTEIGRSEPLPALAPEL
jgi:ABC-type branched-subunit amino acid transport system substrate-binding protein